MDTGASEGWFVWFRFYGPTAPFLDKSWQLPDFEKSQMTTDGLSLAHANMLAENGIADQIHRFVKPALAERFSRTVFRSDPQAGSSPADIVTIKKWKVLDHELSIESSVVFKRHKEIVDALHS